jgi:hypothetical protein
MKEEGEMAKIPDEIKDFLTNNLAYVATVDAKGRPNVVPKGNIAILDDSHVVFADLYAHQTKKNLSENPNIAIVVVSPAGYAGYQIKGKGKIVERGKQYNILREQVSGSGQLNHPNAEYAVKVEVDKIIDVGYGPTADKEI